MDEDVFIPTGGNGPVACVFLVMALVLLIANVVALVAGWVTIADGFIYALWSISAAVLIDRESRTLLLQAVGVPARLLR